MDLPSTNFSPRVAMTLPRIGKPYTLRQATAVYISKSCRTILFHQLSRLTKSSATIFSYLRHHGLSINLWQPIQQRSSSNIACFFALLGTTVTTALSATVGSLAIALSSRSGAFCQTQIFPSSIPNYTAGLTISRKALSLGS